MTSTQAGDVWKSGPAQQLAQALTKIGDVPTMRAFLRDVMTAGEIAEISSRLEAARMLQAGSRYTDITDATNLSSRTIARISEWLQEGCGGYDAALRRLDKHPHHA